MKQASIRSALPPRRRKPPVRSSQSDRARAESASPPSPPISRSRLPGRECGSGWSTPTSTDPRSRSFSARRVKSRKPAMSSWCRSRPASASGCCRWGHLVAPGKALAWRGPMAGGALTQLMDAAWGDTEVLLVDLPPGTGDVQLTMLQKFKPAGAVLVSTPQDLALIDAARAGQLFDAGGVPIIGLVENMAGYACPHCGKVSDPFGTGGVETAAGRLELPFLGRIPLHLAIRQGGDSGEPPAASDDAVARAVRRDRRHIARMADRERIISRLPVSRRGLLTGGALAGGLVVAWTFWPRHYGAPLTAGEGEFAFGGWLTIGRDGVVTVSIPQLEMGQGVKTVLAQVAAVELGADWRQIAVEPAPPAGLYANLPLAAEWAELWALVPGLADTADDFLVERFARSEAFGATAAGTSLAAYEMPLREAARQRARHADPCRCRAIRCRARGVRSGERPRLSWRTRPAVRRTRRCGGQARSARRGPRCARRRPSRSRPSARPRRRPPFPGSTCLPRSTAAFCSPATCDCRAWSMPRSGTDPGDCPKSFASMSKRVAGMRGLVRVVQSKRWVAAVATSWWTADQALARMRVHFSGPGAIDQAWLDTLLEMGLAEAEDRAERIATIGDPDDALGASPFIRRYAIAPAAHTPVETASATARLEGGAVGIVDGGAGARGGAQGGSQGGRPFGDGRRALSDGSRRQLRCTVGETACHRSRTDRGRSGPTGATHLVASTGFAGRAPAPADPRRTCRQRAG